MVFGLLKKKLKKSKNKPKEKRITKSKTVKRAKRPRRIGTKGKGGRSAAAKKVAKTILEQEVIGEVTHYFPKVKACVISISKGEVNIGDTFYIKGHTTDFKQKVTSMQINHVPIKTAKKGDEIGLLVKKRVRGGDTVYKV